MARLPVLAARDRRRDYTKGGRRTHWVLWFRVRPGQGLTPRPSASDKPRMQPAPRLDIVIPVFNEGRNIVATLAAFAPAVRTPAPLLTSPPFPADAPLPAVRARPDVHAGLAVEFVRNPGRGAHQAVTTGFKASTAPFVVMYAADDDYNSGILDQMVTLGEAGCDIVCASRFMPG